ncbi:hypothetical protein [Staphylococcus delphini]|nr:hypothetical protein [Staphylococcus delphini]
MKPTTLDGYISKEDFFKALDEACESYKQEEKQRKQNKQNKQK